MKSSSVARKPAAPRGARPSRSSDHLPHSVQLSHSVQLFAISFITLFLELMIIRWVPASIRLVAYFANLMLISSFLGIGLGALLKYRSLNLFRWFPLILLTFVLLVTLSRNIYMPGSALEHRYYAVPPSLVNFAVLIGVFLLNTALFIHLGERIGYLFDSLPPLHAYSFDLAGSLAGTIVFGVFSFLFFGS